MANHVAVARRRREDVKARGAWRRCRRPGAQGAVLLSFSFPVTGRYADLKRFLYEVETSGRLIGIESAELKSEKGGVSLTLKLLTYVRGQ